MLRALLVACVAVAAGGAAGGDATVSGVYLWRMRKAGSGSLQLLTEHYARAGHYFVVPNARTCVEIKFTARSSRHLLDGVHGDAESSPPDRASAATSSPRTDSVKNYRVHPTHWLISTQARTTMKAIARPLPGVTGRFESAVEVVFYLGGMALCPTLLVISNGWLIAC